MLLVPLRISSGMTGGPQACVGHNAAKGASGSPCVMGLFAPWGRRGPRAVLLCRPCPVGSCGALSCTPFGCFSSPLITPNHCDGFCLASLHSSDASPKRHSSDFIQLSERWGIVRNLLDPGNWQETGNLNRERNTSEVFNDCFLSSWRTTCA